MNKNKNMNVLPYIDNIYMKKINIVFILLIIKMSRYFTHDYNKINQDLLNPVQNNDMCHGNYGALC